MLAACGSGDAPPDRSAGSDKSAAGDSYFPVTLESTYGPVTIPQQPQRIAYLRWDIQLAYAADAPAKFQYMWGQRSTKEEIIDDLYPWMDGKFDVSTVRTDLNVDGKANPEVLAALQPDLIVGDEWNIPDQETFDRLSKIAPTWPGTVRQGEDLPWRDELTQYAQLTGTMDAAEQSIAEADDKFAAARKELAGLQGKTFQLVYVGDDGTMSLTGETLPLELGLVPGDGQPKLFGQKQTELSPEELSRLNADVLFIGGAPGVERGAVENLRKDPRFAKLPAVQNNAVVWFDTKSKVLLRPMPPNVDAALDYYLPILKKSSYLQGE